MKGAAVRLARRALAAAGLQLRRWPAPLARDREAELRIGLPHALALHAWRHPERPGGDFFFLQVGAYDGVANDPVRELVLSHGWRGILLEPQREAFRALERTYAGRPGLVLRNAAIAETSGRRELYKVRPGDGLPDWAPQLASFRRETILRHRDVIPDVAERIVTETVECVTFADLLAPAPPARIDLLQVDAEGYDFEVLKLFHGAGFRAEVIGFEHKHLSRRERDACVAHLVGLGYRVALDGPDAVASRRGDALNG